MAGTGVTMDASQFYKRTGKMLRHMKNTSKLTKSIGETLVSSTRERFRKEEDPEGNKWKKSKRAEAQGGQTLSDKGRLKGGIHYEASSDKVIIGVVGSNLVYAAIHQFGGQAGPRNRRVTINKRAYVGLSKEDKEEVNALVREFMARGWRI